MSEYRKGPEFTKSPEELETWAERLEEAIIEDGITFAGELGQRVPMESLLESIEDDRTFFELTEPEKKRVLGLFRDTLGRNLENADSKPQREYSMQGTPGSEGAGNIQVEVFDTNQEDVYLRRYTYTDGDISFSLGPETLEEEE